MSRLGIVSVLAILGLSATAAAQAPQLEKLDVVLRSVPDGPVAHINGAPIPRAEFVQMYGLELMRTRRAMDTKEIEDGIRIGVALRSLSQLVNQELLYQEAKNKGLKIPPSTVEEQWSKQLKEFQTREPGATEEQILAAMGVQDKSELLTQIERMLLIDEMSDRVVKESGIKVEEKELRDLFAKNEGNLNRPATLHLRQLFVRSGPGDAERQAAKSRAEHAMARVNAGQRFAGVIKEVSDSPGAENGGDMGPWPVEQFPPFLAEPALKMQPEQISGIIESEFGFHIIQLVNIEQGAELTFDEAKPMLERMLRSRKGDAAVLAYCETLINGEADILVYLELEKTLATNPKFADLLEPNEPS